MEEEGTHILGQTFAFLDPPSQSLVIHQNVLTFTIPPYLHPPYPEKGKWATELTILSHQSTSHPPEVGKTKSV